jgi:hypothetical protein
VGTFVMSGDLECEERRFRDSREKSTFRETSEKLKGYKIDNFFIWSLYADRCILKFEGDLENSRSTFSIQ